MGALQELAAETYGAFRPPKKLTVSEWADGNRVLVSEGSAEPGAWRTDRAPYQRAIMDAFNEPGVWQIVVMSSAQTGKSEAELNMMGYAIDTDPGPILYIQPTKEVAEDYSKRRVAPMISSCAALRRKVAEAKGRDSANTITMKTFPGGSLAIIGANSPSELASKPIRYIFMDEVDRFPASAGTEGDPQELAERRTETFRHNRKIVKTSTPTVRGGNIERAYRAGTQEEWQTMCPHCGEYAMIKFSEISFQKEEIRSAEGDTDYLVTEAEWACPNCGAAVGEHEAKRQPGRWQAQNGGAIANGIRSFKMNAFTSPWSDWRDIARKFLLAKGDAGRLQVFHNTILGESWQPDIGDGLAGKLYARREHYDSEAPRGALVLTMGIDTQDNRLEYEVVGWGRDGESWGICRGVIPGRADAPGTWQDVDGLLDRSWRTASGARLHILATFIDSGGHFTQDVYRECAARAARRVFAIKGEAGEGKEYVRPMHNSKTHREAMKFLIGVDAGKGGVLYEAGIPDPGPGYMHFPLAQDAGYDREFFRGLISERLVARRRSGKTVMVWEQTRKRNEPLDCRNYARAAFRYFHWPLDKIEREIAAGGNTGPAVVKESERRASASRHVVSKGITI